jgi:hypothetical protein
MQVWRAHHECGDHRRCLQFDLDCDLQPFLSRIITEGQHALRESGEIWAVVAFEEDGGLRIWGTTSDGKERTRLKHRAYRHYDVRGLVAHGVVYIVQDDREQPLI